MSKNIGIGKVYTYRLTNTKNVGYGYVQPENYIKTRNIGIGRFTSVDVQHDASEGLVIIDGETCYIVPDKYGSVGPQPLPSIIVNVDIDAGTVTILGQIKNASETYQIYLDDVSYGVVTDSFEITLTKQDPGTYAKTVKIVGEDTGTTIEKNFTYEVEQYIPEPADMTLRFLFSNETSDPTTLGTVGTWTKVDNHPDGNVWDWTYDNSNWSSAFANKLKTTFDPDIRIIDVGDTSNVIYTCTGKNGMFQFCTALTSVSLFDTSSVTNMGYMFYGCNKLTSVPLFDTSSVTSMSSMFRDCYNVESGALALYKQAVATGKVSYHYYTFENCGTNTTTGLAELKLIPTDWGGLFVEPVLALDTQVNDHSVTISGTITNAAEDYIIDINHEQHIVTGNSFQFTYDNLESGSYEWEVIMIGDKSGYAYQTTVQFTIEEGEWEPYRDGANVVYLNNPGRFEELGINADARLPGGATYSVKFEFEIPDQTKAEYIDLTEYYLPEYGRITLTKNDDDKYIGTIDEAYGIQLGYGRIVGDNNDPNVYGSFPLVWSIYIR